MDLDNKETVKRVTIRTSMGWLYHRTQRIILLEETLISAFESSPLAS